MKKICIITTCRADFGYLYFLMKGLHASDKFQLEVICPENHHCYKEIEEEFLKGLTWKIRPIYGIHNFGKFYEDCLNALKFYEPDMVIVLGDRFEMLATATAALLLNVKICHLYGGECTLGAFDNEIRNAITQMAQIHFTSTFDYSVNVQKLTGLDIYNSEYPPYDIDLPKEGKLNHGIFYVGSTGLDWLYRAKLLSEQELQQYVSIDLSQPFAIACYNPETKALEHTKEHIKNLLNALDSLDMQFVFIKPNCDPTNDIISDSIDEYWKKYDGVNCDGMPLVMITKNLDHLVYLSLLQYAEFMIGNSSSGIIESASFNIPSISVGNRQKGRIRNSNTFDCPCETQAILDAVDRAREWNTHVGKCENVYGDGHSTERIIKILEEI